MRGVAPNDWEDLAVSILRLYENAQVEIMAKIAKYTTRGLDAPDYQTRALLSIRRAIEDTRKTLAALQKASENEIADIIERVYYSAMVAGEDELFRAGKVKADTRVTVPGTNITLATRQVIRGAFTDIDRRAIAAIVAKTNDLLLQTHMIILRQVDDIYRQVVARVAAEALTGVHGNRINAAQKVLNEFATRGVGAFIDKAGRVWEMATYAEMATRSSIGQATVEGFLNRMEAYGWDLVYVSDHPEECEKCRPWEGKILSANGQTPGYPTVAEARAAGLFHPRCGHRLVAYIEGYSKPKAKADPGGYAERQQQRYIERNIRLWKRKAAVAVTDEEKRRTAAKVREWQGKMKQFIDRTGRRRKYEREQISRAF